MSNPFEIYSNKNMHIVTFMNQGINYIHDIQVIYGNANRYILIFMIPGVNIFLMPGVNSIYNLYISYDNTISSRQGNRKEDDRTWE